jgi:hypothetical protein
MRVQIKFEDGDNEFCDSIEDAIAYLESQLPATYTFYYIGGYECLRDGTKEDGSASTIKEAQNICLGREIEYDDSITDLDEFIEHIEPKWAEYHDDGGGSGWIE